MQKEGKAKVPDEDHPPSTLENQLDKIRRRMNAFRLAAVAPVLRLLKSGFENIFLNKDEVNGQGQEERDLVNKTIVTSKPYIRVYTK